jgi:hypothetical protein
LNGLCTPGSFRRLGAPRRGSVRWAAPALPTAPDLHARYLASARHRQCRAHADREVPRLAEPLSAPELGAVAIRAALERAGIPADQVQEVIMGNVVQGGVGQAPARQALLKAGIPATVSALTINKVCGSGLKAVMLAAQAIKAGDAEVIVAGGQESMSNAPFYVYGMRNGVKLGDQSMVDGMIKDGLWCGVCDVHMGGHAEYTAARRALARAAGPSSRPSRTRRPWPRSRPASSRPRSRR